MKHIESIEVGQREIRKLTEWTRFQQWLCGGAILMLLGIGAWCWHTYYLVVPLDLQIFAGLLGSVILIILFVQINTLHNNIKLLQREEALNSLRFDMFRAAEDAFGAIVAKHAEDFHGLNGNLSVGEAMLEKVDLQTERYSAFQQRLAAAFPGMQMAEAIDALVATTATRHETDASVALLSEHLLRHGKK